MPPQRRSRVSACLIVKDEAHNLHATATPLQGLRLPDRQGRGAQSARLTPLVGLVDEIVVIDTGSTDGTAEVARQLGARV